MSLCCCFYSDPENVLASLPCPPSTFTFTLKCWGLMSLVPFNTFSILSIFSEKNAKPLEDMQVGYTLDRNKLAPKYPDVVCLLNPPCLDHPVDDSLLLSPSVRVSISDISSALSGENAGRSTKEKIHQYHRQLTDALGACKENRHLGSSIKWKLVSFLIDTKRKKNSFRLDDAKLSKF